MVDARRLTTVLAIYVRLVAARTRADWQYRSSFVLFLLSQFFVTFIEFLAIVAIFTNVTTLAGWSFAEVAFLYATSGVSLMLCDVFVSEVEYAEQHIRKGTFDQFLLRPLGPLVQLCAHEFALRRVGKLAQSVVVLGIAIAMVPVGWTGASVVTTAVTIVAGAVIFSALSVVVASAAFWLVGTGELSGLVLSGGNYASQYPLDLYAAWLRRVLLISSIAFVNYVPVSWILGKSDATGLPSWCAFLSPAVALTSAWVATRAWRAGIRRYRSTGT